jgi:peptide/nickel transport system permease protein
MQRFIVQRSLGIVGVLVGVLLVVFLLPRLSPTDPCLAMLGDKATDSQIAACQARYRLDQPLHIQLGWSIGNLLRGDLGTSIYTGRAVIDDLRERLPATLELSLAGLSMTLLFGFPLGILAARYQCGWLDWLIRAFSIAGGTLPVFLLGLLLKDLLSTRAGWFPHTGRIDESFALLPQTTGLYTIDSLLAGNIAAFSSSLRHLALPALTLGIAFSAVLIRILNAALLEVLAQSYILAAHARGVSRWRILLRHALKNALVPALTIVGLTLGNLLSGTVLTEYVYSWPGIGRYAAEAARTNDFPAIIGVTLIAALVYPVSHLVIECFQRWLDPRIAED